LGSTDSNDLAYVQTVVRIAPHDTFSNSTHSTFKEGTMMKHGAWLVATSHDGYVPPLPV
jgi:hypothetical protein